MDALKVKFGERWGCDLSHIETPDKSPSGVRLATIGSPTQTFDGSIDSLKLSFNGRWGNYVLQLINMFYLAEKLCCNQLYLNSTDVFPIISSREILGIKIDNNSQSHSMQGYQLESVFFHMHPFQALMTDLTPDRRRELATKYVRPLLSEKLRPRTESVARGDLVFHIRSGDIFQGPEGQGGSEVGGSLYPQPPLAFYTTIAEAVLHRSSGNAVIVSENSLNPTIFPLVAALEKIGFAVSLRLRHDLLSDLGFLFAGGHVVFANGTIGIGVALLSDAISDAYFFRKDGTGTPYDVDVFLGDYLSKHFILDDDGTYIRKGEWKNTSEQRQLMLSLPASKLRWEKYPVMENIALNKPARQSSVSPFSVTGESGRAVNGIIDGNFSFHTEREHFPWWEVDFQGRYRLDQILIYNREQLPERAYGLQVFVLGDDDKWSMIHDQRGVPFGGPGGKPARILPKGFPGRALRIQLPCCEYLHLCEVEVYTVNWLQART